MTSIEKTREVRMKYRRMSQTWRGMKASEKAHRRTAMANWTEAARKDLQEALSKLQTARENSVDDDSFADIQHYIYKIEELIGGEDFTYGLDQLAESLKTPANR